jgi:pantetheine-phosphate adenylyltransferase
MPSISSRSSLGYFETVDSRAVYPGTFDPFTEGHRDVVDRVRLLFDQVTVLVAVNPDKQPTETVDNRAARIAATLPSDWSNVVVVAWAGLTADYCRLHGAGVVVRGVRNRADFRHEYPLAVMNEEMGVSTLLVPARPDLAAVSSTAARQAM